MWWLLIEEYIQEVADKYTAAGWAYVQGILSREVSILAILDDHHGCGTFPSLNLGRNCFDGLKKKKGGGGRTGEELRFHTCFSLFT